jgi:hypothetical protein
MNFTVASIPEGAAVYCEGKFWGKTPVSLEYEYGDTAVDHKNHLHFPPITLRWVSGAELVDTPVVDLNRFDDDIVITFERPKNAPNVESDAQYGAQHETNRILQGKLDAMIEEQRRLKRAIENQNE